MVTFNLHLKFYILHGKHIIKHRKLHITWKTYYKTHIKWDILHITISMQS